MTARAARAAVVARGVASERANPVPVGDELERLMSALGRLAADLWFEGRLDARTVQEDATKSED